MCFKVLLWESDYCVLPATCWYLHSTITWIASMYLSKNDMVTECLTHIRFIIFWTELSEQSLLKYQKETLWGSFKKPSLIKDYVVQNLSGLLVLNNPALHHWLEDNLKELFNSLKFDFLLRFTVLMFTLRECIYYPIHCWLFVWLFDTDSGQSSLTLIMKL